MPERILGVVSDGTIPGTTLTLDGEPLPVPVLAIEWSVDPESGPRLTVTVAAPEVRLAVGEGSATWVVGTLQRRPPPSEPFFSRGQ